MLEAQIQGTLYPILDVSDPAKSQEHSANGRKGDYAPVCPGIRGSCPLQCHGETNNAWNERTQVLQSPDALSLCEKGDDALEHWAEGD